MKIKLKKISLLLIVLFLANCGTTAVTKNKSTEERSTKRYKDSANVSKSLNREEEILESYTKERKEKYSELLVNINKYTTRGNIYQKKFNRHLIGIATDITEKKKMIVEKGSIGFYFEKKSGNKDRLYLGIDINTGKKFKNKYGYVARHILKNNLVAVLETVHACRSIFFEDQIFGMVLGFKWTGPRWSEVVSIWITKEDVLGFESSRVTFEELLQKSTITDTRGKVIVLPE